MTDADHIARLHATLRRRETPETVADLIREAIPPQPFERVTGMIRRIVRGSSKGYFGWSSMATRFREPDSAERQIAKARELALLFLGQTLPEGDDPDALDAVIGELNRLIGKTPRRNSFMHDRLPRPMRAEIGLKLSRRRYSKLFRLAGRLERKAASLRLAEEMFDLVLVSKAALGPRLTIEDFRGNVASAAFVAYYAARMKLRSEFTNASQQRPFDEFAAELLRICERGASSSWWAIAHVFPRADVLARLTDEERGRLLGQSFNVLQTLAEKLDDLRGRTEINIDTMIVMRGNDSTTWNILAGAWNRARDHWIALVEAMGVESLLDEMMPGKVMRLMAADVAAWHRASGGGVHPDTLVWRDLPPPWDVLRGEASCTRAEVDAVCAMHGVNPARSGWSRARARTAVAQFRPTPELVHGVAISNPYLADYLRRAGVFSGKRLKPVSPPR